MSKVMELTADEVPELASGTTRREWWSFFGWSAGSYLVITVYLATSIYRHSRGRIIYLLDDAAIHLDVARDLAYHFTWGIEPGHFESASSSPLWTIVLAVLLRPFSFAATWLPLVLTVASSLALIALFANFQHALRPNWRRPVDIVAVVVVTNVILFLPALTLLGMEHVLHAALVVAAAALIARQLDGSSTWGPAWLPIPLLALAEMTRLETVFVSIGLVVAIGCMSARGHSWPGSAQRSLVLRCTVATAIPFVLFGAINRALGGGWLPNSLLSRSNSLGTSSSFTLHYFIVQWTKDRLLLACAVTLFAVVVWGWREMKGYVAIAIATLVAMVLQVIVASIGQYERYQEYLIALSVYVVLMAAGDIRQRWRPTVGQWSLALGVAVALGLVVSSQRVTLLRRVPMASADVYQQKYLAGEFLEKYYRNQPVASGELGWIAWLHRGNFVGLLGLGDYDVLQELRATSGKPPKEYWSRLASQDHFPIVVEYPRTLGAHVPTSWIWVGTWVLHRHVTTAYQRDFEFWVTTPQGVVPLQNHLRAFARQLPPGESLRLDPFANLIAERDMSHRPVRHG